MALNPYNDAYPPKGFLPTEQDMAAEKDWTIQALRAQLTQAQTERDALAERVRVLEATLPDPDQLEMLACWTCGEVQADLRRWADGIRAALPPQQKGDDKP